MYRLTDKEKYLLNAMYNEFLNRYNDGVSKEQAMDLGNSDSVLKLTPKLTEDVLLKLIADLKKKGFLFTFNGSDSFYKVELTTKAISYMERNKY